uniref:Serendipity alpha n=1 Tax=Anastrepha suspensa TaxID=28587 RepID=H9ZIN8_9MUSC|nr:serendipity alpha [Anastrepha suspensa]
MATSGVQVLKSQLSRCRKVIALGCRDTNSRIGWLNNFCGGFFEFANRLHKYITDEVEELEGNENVDTTFLCLTQVCLCTKYLERVIRAEETACKPIPSSRKHFIDRIMWCLDRLEIAVSNLTEAAIYKTSEQALSGYGFIALLEMAMDQVSSFSTYQDDPDFDPHSLDELKYALDSSNEIHRVVRSMVAHTLALANVAFFEDKTALSALCQKALRDSTAFQQECCVNLQQARSNQCNRRLKAIALGDSLNQLHQYVDETILRLIFICFADLEKFSLDKLRAKMRQCGSDDVELDEFIADFDVNLDRLAQIGLFAANESPTPKLKTLVRSCMASLEALDACIIPSLQASNGAEMHSEILEQHFYEEMAKLESVIYEIIDAQPITRSFYEMLNACIAQTEKQFNKSKLEDMVQMGEFLLQYFQYPTNKRELQQTNCKRLEYFQKFTMMLHECRAILVCADQVDTTRILKRFKILRDIVSKFVHALEKTSNQATKEIGGNLYKLTVTETQAIDLNEPQLILETIEPSVCSILYRNESEMYTPRRRAVSDSMRGNYSKYSTLLNEGEGNRRLNTVSGSDWQQALKQRHRGSSVRRNESLRTVMFKRQKSAETQKACDFYLHNSASLQISEIIDQLKQVSVNDSGAAGNNC